MINVFSSRGRLVVVEPIPTGAPPGTALNEASYCAGLRPTVVGGAAIPPRAPPSEVALVSVIQGTLEKVFFFCEKASDCRAPAGEGAPVAALHTPREPSFFARGRLVVVEPIPTGAPPYAALNEVFYYAGLRPTVVGGDPAKSTAE
ncbi:MAG: hypothetical protein ACKPKO_46560 [Candidatus Fonsibacter sp.]